MEPCLTLDSNYTCTQPPPNFNITRPNFCQTAPPTTKEPTTVSSTLTSTVISTASDIISTVITNASSTLTQSSIIPGPPTSPSTSTATTQPTEKTISPRTTNEPEEGAESWVVGVSCCASLAAIAIVVVIIILYKRRNRRDNEMQDESGGPQPFETQNSTYGLIGKDEPDTGGNTYSVEKEAFSRKDEINNGIENKGLSEDDPKKEEKPAPVVQMTEL